jgi:hypothetical protein
MLSTQRYTVVGVEVTAGTNPPSLQLVDIEVTTATDPERARRLAAVHRPTQHDLAHHLTLVVFGEPLVTHRFQAA